MYLYHFRSLAQMSVLFGQVVRGLSAGSRVFEVGIYEAFVSILKICRIFSLTLKNILLLQYNFNL